MKAGKEPILKRLLGAASTTLFFLKRLTIRHKKMNKEVDWSEVKKEERVFFNKVAADMLGVGSDKVTPSFLSQRSREDIEAARKNRSGAAGPLSLEDMKERFDKNLKSISKRSVHVPTKK